MRNTKLARQLRPFLNSPSAAVAIHAPGGGADHPAATGGPGILVDGNQVVSLDPAAVGGGLQFASGVVSLGTPGNLSATSASAAFGTTHTHAVIASADVSGGQSALLKSSAGNVRLQTLHVPAIYTMSGNLSLLPASGVVTLPGGAVLNTAGGGYTLSPADDLTLNPGGKDVFLSSAVNLGAHNYQSQLNGWRITHDGAADFRYLFVNEMHAKSFIADLEQALAGAQIIAKSVAVIAYDFTAPAPGGAAFLYVRDLPGANDMQVFQAGDIVRVRTFSRAGGGLSITDCWGAVSAPSVDTGPSGVEQSVQRWTFTRSAAPNAGAMTAGTVVKASSLALDYGTDGSGLYEVNAIDGLYGANSPYIRFITWSGHPATGSTVAVQLGKLSGLAGIGQAGEFGLYIRGKSAGDYLLASPLQGVNLVTAGGGVRITEVDGIEVAAPSTQSGSRTIKFTSAGATYGELYTLRSSFGADVYLQSRETDAARDARTQVNAYHTGASGGNALVTLGADPGGSGTPLLFSLDARGSLDGWATLLAPQFDVLAHVTIKKASPFLRISSTATGQNVVQEFRVQDLFSVPSDILKGRIIYAGSNTAGIRYFGLINDDADFLAMLSDQHRWTSKTGSEWMRLTNTGLGIGNTNPQEKLHVSGAVLCQKVIMSTPGAAPANSADNGGTTGEMRWDANYLYLRVGVVNPYWKRIALSTF